MSHYDTLQVAPWAEDAVVHAAYRALMRLYHPDTNRDAQTALRAREITSAFAVLGDPAKRAAYDALPALRNETEPREEVAFADEHSRPPMRNVGVASVALALALSLAVAVWPESRPRPTPQKLRTAAASLEPMHVATAAHRHARQDAVVAPASGTQGVSRGIDRQPVLPPAPANDAIPDQANSHAPPVPRRKIAQAAVQRGSASMPIAAVRTPGTRPGTPAQASCGRGSPEIGNGDCKEDRQAQIERIAAGFLNQSLEHADWQKQQLLLSARNRSAFSRALCRSDECVTEAYLHQIRDTMEIMDGRIPTP